MALGSCCRALAGAGVGQILDRCSTGVGQVLDRVLTGVGQHRCGDKYFNSFNRCWIDGRGRALEDRCRRALTYMCCTGVDRCCTGVVQTGVTGVGTV
ncbi:hypothetical protein Hamer_G026194 [Homarus americanus]|uniref:Uncharacterized protein n=1 Tax=Homarus americanus TaxID=6706 RepID=A0A8J5K5T6_HOMAM|nr:hypothetical protein Hamer_G026194 [Homarus americanus]